MLIKTDDEGFPVEPCLSCEKAYVENLDWSLMCDEKKCVHKEEYDEV